MNLDIDRNKSSSSLVSRSRSRSNSMMKYDEFGKPINNGHNLNIISSTINKVNEKMKLDKDKDKHEGNHIIGTKNLNTSEEKLDIEKKPAKPDKPPHEEGLFSSLLTIAHNSMIKSTDKVDKSDTSAKSETDNSTFSKNLDELIKHDETQSPSESQSKSQTHSQSQSQSNLEPPVDLQPVNSPKNIHFESVRESPINTMGQGSLRLEDFLDVDEPNDENNLRKNTVVSDQESITSSGSIKFASNRRNKEFHQIFKKLPKEEHLIDDFSCALSKDILVQGRMYLSENFICFKSNILGWVTNLLIPLQEVVQIEKRSTAVLFPNGMIIRTLYQKYTFATFISRDNTFRLLTKVWHRVLMDNDQSFAFEPEDEEEDDDIDDKEVGVVGDDRTSSSETGVVLNDDDGVDAFNDQQIGEVDVSESDGDEAEDEADDEDEDDADSGTGPGGDDLGTGTVDISKTTTVNGSEGKRSRSTTESKTFNGLPLIGPLHHAPTSLGYEKSNNEVFITEDEFKAPMGTIFSLLFGKDNSYYIKILKNQKNIDIDENNITGISNINKERNYKYIKPLGGAIGPKQTSCIINDKVIDFDINQKILVEQTTSTPDVPSGNAFKIRTKIFLYWGANNTTKFYVITQVEWSGKSWIKGPIEKGSIDGQKESMKILIDSINDILKSETGKKRKKRAPTIVKKDDEVKEVVAPPPTTMEPSKPLSLLDKINDVADTIGGNIPIPMIPSVIMGYIIVFITLLLAIKLHNLIFTGHDKFKMVDNSIMVNNRKFLLIPSIDNNFQSPNVMNSEVNLWRWIEDRANDELFADNNYVKEYNHQELHDAIRLTQLKLAKLTRDLNNL